MEKAYEQVSLKLGSTIDEAVEHLLHYRSQGILASFKFNGVILYSDTVTIDSAYLQITGMTKTQLFAM